MKCSKCNDSGKITTGDFHDEDGFCDCIFGSKLRSQEVTSPLLRVKGVDMSRMKNVPVDDSSDFWK